MKGTIKIFETILENNFSDALKTEVKHALTIYKNINSEDEVEVFNYQFGSLINLCKYYIQTYNE